MVNLELINGCKTPKTLELYSRCSINPHVNALSMNIVDDEGCIFNKPKFQIK